MKRNSLRIVCNPSVNQISYHFKNEVGEWIVLSGSSPLSRKFYSKTTMKERGKEIIEKIDEIYNRKNKGVDIWFEGTAENFECLKWAIKLYCPDRDIVCKQRMTKIAVVGKIKVGKSSLIKGLEKFQKHGYQKTIRPEYTEYLDREHNIRWYEIKGIDLGKEKVKKAFSTISNLVLEDLSTVIYCVSGITGRIEETEMEFIKELNNRFPTINLLTAITQCYKDDVRVLSDEIEKLTKHMDVFPVLAEEYRGSQGQGGTENYVVEPFGLDALHTYVFEGKKAPRQYQAKKVPRQYQAKKVEQNEVQGVGRTEAKTQPQAKKKQGNINRNDVSYSEKITKSKPLINKPSAFVPDSKRDPIKKKVAVVGKKAVGKTSLIEGLERLKAVSFRRNLAEGEYSLYEDESNRIQWYEVKGIDLGKNRIEETYSIIKTLVSQGVSAIAYCISAEAGRIEDIERNFIKRLTKDFSSAQVIIVFTRCFKEDIQEMIDDVQGISNQIRIVQTLAKEYKTAVKNPSTGMSIVIEPFGLDDVYNLCVLGRSK